MTFPESARAPLSLDGTTSRSQARLSTLVPAMHDGQPYVSRLSTRAALYADLHALLTAVQIPVSRLEYRRQVIDENVLARRTFTARKKAWAELAPRYACDSSHPLFCVFLEEYRTATSSRDRDLTAYLLFALQDKLVCDLGTEWLYEYLRSAPAELRTADVLAFLSSREKAHSEVRGWSPATRENVASHYLSALKEFGLARGSQRKMTVRPAPGTAPLRFLLRAVLMSGANPRATIESPLFRLLALSLDETVDNLFRLNADGALRCRIQGDTIELDLGGRRAA